MTKQEFEQRVERIPFSGCWIWMRSCGKPGYGDFRSGGQHHTAHRYAFSLYRGEIPQGQHVLHRCDVRCCVNPEHLFLGTNADNIEDSKNKGRRKGPRHRPSGLVYVRRSPTAYDCRRATTKEQREEIRRLRGEGLSQKRLGEMFGVSQHAVWRVLHGDN